jgi:NAD(P)-dependent dehydrogenase (short-subunit alcohol dehydrogenase family)
MNQGSTELQGKVALVTGAGSGIGKAAAVLLAREGATVGALSHTEDEIRQTVREIEDGGGKAVALVADVADAAAMERAVGELAGRFGHLDIVFANAGINGVWAPIDELKPKEWDETIRVNLRGTYLTLHHAVPLMGKGGSIVITASINGTRTFTSAGASAYSTTKAGQLALGQMLALELAPRGIRVNVICPGAITTEIDDNTKKRATARAKIPARYPKGTVPLTGGDPGTAQEVADLIAFLASDKSRHISGTPVWIDGAQSLLV